MFAPRFFSIECLNLSYRKSETCGSEQQRVRVSPRTYAPEPITPTKLRGRRKNILASLSSPGLESITCVKYERREMERFPRTGYSLLEARLETEAWVWFTLKTLEVLCRWRNQGIFHWRARNYLNRLLPAFVESISTCRNIYVNMRERFNSFPSLSSRLVVEDPWLRVGNLL